MESTIFIWRKFQKKKIINLKKYTIIIFTNNNNLLEQNFRKQVSLNKDLL